MALKNTLSKAHDKETVLNQALKDNEKKISDCVQELRALQSRAQSKQEKIARLTQNIAGLNGQLSKQQQQLAAQVRLRLQMGQNQAIIGLINRETPAQMGRLLSFQQFFIQARKRMISQVAHNTERLLKEQHLLATEVKAQEALHIKLKTQQSSLENNKGYHKELMQVLKQDIQSQESALKQFERNKQNLTQLLKALSAQKIQYNNPKQPFITMRHKLPRPVVNFQGRPQKLGQGLTFLAKEGAGVQAVYPGKIVFSDWLNGYGLLLIIDHGRGFMTLYAHNQSLLKKKGNIVHQGETIALVGHSGRASSSGLYFEVRRNGKAVFPSEWIA